VGSLGHVVREVLSESLAELFDGNTVVADSLLDVLGFVLLDGKDLGLDLTECALGVLLDGVLDHLEFDEGVNR
jgi:hypothetical protein